MSIRGIGSISGYSSNLLYQPRVTRDHTLKINTNDSAATKARKTLINNINAANGKADSWKTAKSQTRSSSLTSDVKGYESWLKDGAAKGYLQSMVSDLGTARTSNTGSALNDYYLSQLTGGSGYGSSGLSAADSLKAWAMGQMNQSLMNLF